MGKAETFARRTLAAAAAAGLALCAIAHADEGPLTLARDGYFYVGGRPTVVAGRVMMLEKNNREIAAVIAKWLDQNLSE